MPDFNPRPFTLCRIAAPLLAAWLALAGVAPARAATATATATFNFAHTGSVSTGLLSIGGTFTNTTTASATAMTLPQFNPALGRLTSVSVSATTTTASFAIAPTGLLSLISSGSATRRLTYAVTAGSVSGGDFNEVVTTGGTLLTLLSLGGGEIGGAPLAKSTAFSAGADLPKFSGSGSIMVNVTASDTLSVFALVSALNGGGLTGSGTYTGSVSVTYQYTPWAISGSVYRDADHNGARGLAETGTGLALYAKLVSGGTGPALLAVAVDPATGAYSLPAATGAYRVVIDDNASLADVTPLQPPSGWSVTQAASMYRDISVTGDLPNQDFGLVQATSIAGQVFIDDGKGSGIANNGVRDGTEIAAFGKSVELVDANGALLDSTSSAGDGSYRLYIPASTANGATLRVRQGADAATLTTSVGLGNSAGSFDRPTRSIAFAYASNASYSNVNFGCVALPTLSADQAQAGLPGSTLSYMHRFTTASAGQLSFSTSHGASASLPNWSEVVYLDANANGRVDSGEAPVSGPIGVVAGQTVAVILKVSIPANAALTVRLQTFLQATIVMTNAVPALTQALSTTDSTATLAGDGGSLSLVTSVDKASAAPGMSLTYTLTFQNMGTSAISNLTLSDSTPGYTTFQSMGPVVMPAGLSSPTTTTPGAGAQGPVRWVFGGQLSPNASGSVQFTVQIAP